MAATKIALTSVLPEGQASVTVVHLKNPYSLDDKFMLCGQYEDEHVAHRGTTLDVNCMTCLVHAGQLSIQDNMIAALGVPKEFLYGSKEDDSAEDQ